jgi:hypothetical protein
MTSSFYFNLLNGLNSVSKTTRISANRAIMNRIEPLESIEYMGRSANSKQYFI